MRTLKIHLQVNKRETALSEISPKIREPTRDPTGVLKLSFQDHRTFPDLLEDTVDIETNYRHLITVNIISVLGWLKIPSFHS